MKFDNKKKSALCLAKPLTVKWNKTKAKAVVRFVATLSNGQERGINTKMMYK